MALRDTPPSHLKKLNAHNYEAFAWVHWSMTIQERKQGWLDSSMHQTVRELLLHTCARYHLHCPAYCLMPDHAHFLWMGTDSSSNQLNAAKFFRRFWNQELKKRGMSLQSESYDHVLLENEKRPEAFEDTVLYIMKNPERAGLTAEWKDWEYGGGIIPGYPKIPHFPFSEFWSLLWKIHNPAKNSED